MGRKNSISKIYPRDLKALGALARCGHASHNQLGEYVRDKRLTTYQRAGLVARVSFNRPGDGSKDRACYRLTAAGREFCHHELHISGMYQPQSVAHDMGIADRYFSLSQPERDSWRTESQARDMYLQRIVQLRDQGQEELAQSLLDKLQTGEVSPPDAVYTALNGEQVVLEIVTNNYGEAEIEQKVEFAEALDLENSLDFVRI